MKILEIFRDLKIEVEKVIRNRNKNYILEKEYIKISFIFSLLLTGIMYCSMEDVVYVSLVFLILYFILLPLRQRCVKLTYGISHYKMIENADSKIHTKWLKQYFPVYFKRTGLQYLFFVITTYILIIVSDMIHPYGLSCSMTTGILFVVVILISILLVYFSILYSLTYYIAEDNGHHKAMQKSSRLMQGYKSVLTLFYIYYTYRIVVVLFIILILQPFIPEYILIGMFYILYSLLYMKKLEIIKAIIYNKVVKEKI